jgi:hypothetical protein
MKTIAPILAVLAVAFGVRVSAAFDFVGFLKDPPPIRKVVYFRAGEAFQVNGQHLTHPIFHVPPNETQGGPVDRDSSGRSDVAFG